MLNVDRNASCSVGSAMSEANGNGAGKPAGIPATMPGKSRNGKPSGTLRRGGTYPGGGRPPNEYRESLRRLLDTPKVKAAVAAIMSNPKHKQFAALYRSVVSQAHGNPVQPITVDPEALPSFKVECE